MNKVLADILERPIPKGLTIPKVKSLIQSVAKIDEEPKLVYSADGEKILNELNKYGAKDIPQNYRGVLLEHWLDLLSQTPEPITEVPRPTGQDATTLTPDQLKDLGGFADKRSQQNVDIRAREKQTVEDFIKNYQEKIKKIQSIQDEFKDKVIYAKVEVDPKDVVKLEQLETDKQEKIKHYEDLIKQEKFETAKQELSIEIEQRAEKELLNQGITKDEIKRVAIETANEAIEVLSHKEDTTYVSPSYQTAILATVATDSKIISTVIKSKSAEELIKSSASNVAVFRIQPEVLTRSILTTAFGEQFSTIVLGIDPTKVRVSLIETLPQDLTQIQYSEYKEIRLSEINNHQIGVYQGQIEVLDTIANKGKEITTSYIQSNITGFLSKKIEALPAGSVIKKITSTPEMQAVLFAKFGVGSPVTWQYANPVLKRVMGQNQLAGAFFNTAGKALGKEFVKPVVGLATKEVAGQVAGKVVADVGTKAAVGTGLAATITAAFSWTGPLAPVIGAIGAFISTSVIGEGIANLWSKFKTWWTKNRDSLGPIFAVGAGTMGALLFGAGPGLGIGLLVAGATVGFGTLAVGAFGVLGFIGRSIGVAVATPVIVTLLVLPPLVAFIMLVINNSAYVVPPKPVVDSGFIGFSGTTPGAICSKDKLHTSINSGPTGGSAIAERAWGIMEDMYQGFWCYWNRSPGDFPTDTVEHPDSYPDLFDEKLFAKTTNPTREQVQSSGEALFWCTWLVQKAYAHGGVDIDSTLWSPTMLEDFRNRKKLKTGDDMTFNNIESGAVIFFDINNSLARVDHVGIVHTVTNAGIKFLQSNASTKDSFIPFGTDGVLQKPDYAKVEGIGNP